MTLRLGIGAVGLVSLFWLGLTLFVVLTRLTYNVRLGSVLRVRRRLEGRAAAVPLDDHDQLERALRRVPRRTLERVAADSGTTLALAGALARQAVFRSDAHLHAAAAEHGSEVSKWNRIAALRILARGDADGALPLLVRAVSGVDSDVASAALATLGEIGDRQAAMILVQALRDGTSARSRIATQLDEFPLDIGVLLLPLLGDWDASVRYWAVKLLSRYAGLRSVPLELAALSGDEDPAVRAAVAETLGRLGGPAAISIAIELLGDEVPFVRAHAARALGAQGRPELAAMVADLLVDENWWVRSGSKRALAQLGPAAAPYVVRQVALADELARTESAAEASAAEPGNEPAPASVSVRRLGRRLDLLFLSLVAVAAPSVVLLRGELLHAVEFPRLWAAGRLEVVLRWGAFACFLYFLAVLAFHGALVLFAGVDSSVRKRQRSSEDFGALEVSRFSIPVSILSPVYNEEPIAVASMRTLLEQQYREFELIVVDDGSTDGTFARLEQAFALEQMEGSSRRLFPTEPLVGIYRSRLEPRLTVVRKRNGGKADALNCALNFARYRYVLCVDGDTLYRRDALLLGMRAAMRDPARVVGVTCVVALSFQPERMHAQPPGRRSVDRSPLSVFQHLDYLRSFLGSRLAWSQLRFMLCAVGAFSIWRRDVLEELGGFSRAFTCEDIELTFRVHERFLREGRPYEILCMPETVGTSEAPRSLRSLIRQRARWQRVIIETLVAYRRMCGNPRYGRVGMLGFPFYVLSELLAPLFETISLLTIVLAVSLGAISWELFGIVLGLLAFSTAALTNFAVLVDDRTARDYRIGSLVRMLMAGPFDLFLYRPLIVIARVYGTWGYLRGRRDWDKFERNPRAPRRPLRPASPLAGALPD